MRNRTQGRWTWSSRAAVLLAATVLIGTALVSPGQAHVSDSTTHLWKTHVKPLVLKLFYTKSQANARYYTKTQTETRITKRVGPQDYCWYASKNPRSFPSAPCRTLGVVLSPLGDSGFFNSVAIGSDGFPIVSYWERDTGSLTLVHCTNTDCTTRDAPRTLASAGSTGAYTSIAIGIDSYPVISFYGAGSTGGLSLIHCSSVDCSTSDTARILDGHEKVGMYASMSIGADGFPVVSYYDYLSKDLKVVHCTAVDCSTRSSPRVLDSSGDVGSYTSITIGTDGYPVITYFDATAGNLKFIHCTAKDCSTKNASRTFDSSGSVGKFSSIAIGTDGNPIVSYHDSSRSTLKLIHCTRRDCSTRNAPRTLDNAGYIGPETSLKIGTDGFPVISYSDLTASFANLRFIHCTKTNCSATDAPRRLDVDGHRGFYTSMAIGVDGYPVIVHRDLDQADLRLIQVR